MKLFRNPEVKKEIIFLSALSIAASVSSFLLNIYFGIFTLALCTVFAFFYLLTLRKRYKKIAELSESINKILHGDNSISFDDYSEGELGILQSELGKMTVRLRENQRLLQNEKIYLADSIADISHQIRTPLTSINLIVSMLEEPGITDERRLSLTRELDALLSRIDWLITALLKISKLDAGTVSFRVDSIPMSDLIRKSLAPLLVPIELRGQELEVSAEGAFNGDLLWTSEAIGNIVKNCSEHTPEGGKISVKAKETAIYSEIIVTDSGSGIDKEDLPHIFERFYRGKNSGGNSFGIGLALARMIITSQNGTVKAENTGNGAKFTVRFYKVTV